MDDNKNEKKEKAVAIRSGARMNQGQKTRWGSENARKD
jgi:hypothetical protein